MGVDSAKIFLSGLETVIGQEMTIGFSGIDRQENKMKD